MKLKTLLFVSFFIITHHEISAQNVSINNTGQKPDQSAMLDISSPKKGLLIPRTLPLTGVDDKATIEKPAKGLLIYSSIPSINGPDEGFFYNKGTDIIPSWAKLAIVGKEWSLSGNTGTNPSSNFIGTTDDKNIVFKRKSEEVMQIYPGGNIVFTGSTNPTVVPVDGIGTRMLWFPGRGGAFRAGRVKNGFYPDTWNDDKIGENSFGAGENTIAAGLSSVAMGSNSRSFGRGSVAIGIFAVAGADGAAAFGHGSLASGENSTALGDNTDAHAVGATAMGRYNVRDLDATNVPQPQDLIFQVGNGTDVIDSKRHDALTLTRNGDMEIAGMLTEDSDVRLKKDISPLPKVLDKIANIQPIIYYFKDKQLYSSNHQVGFSAQEVQKQFPELVNTNKAGYLSVSYTRMSAILMQAVKEQQEIISQQNLVNEKLVNENIDIKNRLEKLEEIINTKAL